MELCEAGTLEAELVLRKRLDLTETLRLVLPLMGALAFAHDRDVIHRDIKPSNIVLVEERGERRCKLLDFGISLGTGVQGSSDLALGTPAYMAPEQVRGEPSRPGTDVWALGVLLFRCVTGELPFQADSSASLLFKIANERAPRLLSVGSQSSAPNLMRAIDRALEPDLERRYRDMRSFAYAIALASVLDGITLAQRPEPVGLPEFDAWVLSAKAAPATEPLPLPASLQAEVTGAPLTSRRSWAPRALVATALAGAAVGGALTLTAASAPERRNEERRTPANTSAVRPTTNAVLGGVLGAQRTDSTNSPSGISAVPASAKPAVATVPAPQGDRGTKRAPVASRVSVKVRRQGDADPPGSSPAEPASPDVIRDWDW